MSDTKSVPAGFVPPFRLDEFGLYIYDSEGNMAADFYGGFARPRGWGRIQYRENGTEDMKEWVQWFSNVVGDKDVTGEPQKVIELLNTHS